MNKKEIRKELVNEGMYDINNSTFIYTSQEIDLIVDKLEAKINYTRCCCKLKDKEPPTFEEWTKKQGYKQDFFYFKKDKEYLKPTEVLQKYNTYKQNL